MRTFFWIGLLSCLGCGAPRAAESVTPVIAISPNVAGRLALMDRYRLHDEQRKLMMERPHVWVEEAAEDDEETDPGPAVEDSSRTAQ